MRKLLGILMLCLASFTQAQDTNVILYMNVQWSPDGTNWFLNFQFGQTIKYPIGVGSAYLPENASTWLFRSQITTNDTLFLDWRVIDTQLLYGHSAEGVTNVLFPTVEFVVKPTNALYYRPFLVISNFTPQNTNVFTPTDSLK